MQPHPGQTHPGQSHTGAPHPGQQHSVQPHPSQQHLGQQHPGHVIANQSPHAQVLSELDLNQLFTQILNGAIFEQPPPQQNDTAIPPGQPPVSQSNYRNAGPPTPSQAQPPQQPVTLIHVLYIKFRIAHLKEISIHVRSVFIS